MILKLQISQVRELQWMCLLISSYFIRSTNQPPPITHDDHLISVSVLEPISMLPEAYDEKEQITGSQADKMHDVNPRQRARGTVNRTVDSLKSHFSPVFHPLHIMQSCSAKVKGMKKYRSVESLLREKSLVTHCIFVPYLFCEKIHFKKLFLCV